MCEIKTKVVGVSFEGRQREVAKLNMDQDLYLIHEINNEHDPNAVGVYSNDGKIGYIRKSLAAELSDAISRGIKFDCKVISLTGSDESWLGVNISIKRKKFGD